MARRGRAAVTRAIKGLIREYEADVRRHEPRAKTRGLPYAINCGWCSELAETLERRFPAGIMLSTGHAAVNPTYFPYRLNAREIALMESQDHAWFYLNGLHFDAEAPHGVVDWRSLPLFRRAYSKVGQRRKKPSSSEGSTIHSVGFPRAWNDSSIFGWLVRHKLPMPIKRIERGKTGKYAWARLQHVDKARYNYRTDSSPRHRGIVFRFRFPK